MATTNMDNSARAKALEPKNDENKPGNQKNAAANDPKKVEIDSANNNKNMENNKDNDKTLRDRRATRGQLKSKEKENEEENGKEQPEKKKDKIGQRTKPRATMPCEKCKKDVEIMVTECDKTGLAWHSKCFACQTCGLALNEKTVNIRGEDKNQLFCTSHSKSQEGIQPTCKVYFIMSAVRIVF